MTAAKGRPVLVPGDVLDLGEEDYRFGIGALTLRVTVVREVQHLDDGPWVSVQGVAISWDGRDGDQRHVLVRVRAIPRARRTR